MTMTARLIRPGFLAVLVALFAAEGTAAQDPAAAPSGGTSEGIAVHGHWTITIVRDGEVVERREFENALRVDGKVHLASLLSRQQSAGTWSIILASAGPTIGLCAGNTNEGQCTIAEEDAELTVSSTADGSGGQQLVLEGSDTAQSDGNLTVVLTAQESCSPDTAPGACTALEGVGVLFTEATLDPVIPVANGDRIDVTVMISFN